MHLFIPSRRPASDPHTNRTQFRKLDKEAVEVHPQRVGLIANYLPGVVRLVDKSGVGGDGDVERDLTEISVPRCDCFERHGNP